MPYLGDYLGQLLSEIALARMHADLETIRLAELYAAHPLLRSMPVPHVRLPDVELELPILVKTVGEPRGGESPRGGAAWPDLRRKFAEVLSAFLSKAGLALSAAENKKLRAALDERLDALDLPPEISVDVQGMADDLTATALRAIEELKPRSDAEGAAHFAEIAAELKTVVRREFLKIRTPPPRLDVIVTSAEIREASTPENVTRLKLKVSEQGVEWTTIESDGVRRERLVPE